MEISWIAGIDNIAYLEYMREQEETQANEDNTSSGVEPPKTKNRG